MKVLVACEYSGTVRDAFIRLGHDAMPCLVTYCPQTHLGHTIKGMSGTSLRPAGI